MELVIAYWGTFLEAIVSMERIVVESIRKRLEATIPVVLNYRS